MVAKSELKRIRSLHQKKYRIREGQFLAEGMKLVGELLDSGLEPVGLYSTAPEELPGSQPITEGELRKASALVRPSGVLGVFPIPDPEPLTFEGWTLALDGVRDPGNLGTLIRLCDWFGIGELLCSPDTVDCYNPKVLQATMGSIARVRVVYKDLAETLDASGLPVYGASMEGEAIGGEQPLSPGILVMGSESHGLSGPVRDRLSQTWAIPSFGRAESLNVATAAAILLYEIRRATRK
ncbi:TrmH family RNA methyltransferase [Robiginitalea biformata]|uniref:rRNA methylase n=1 Tax=Robiginitalea biformata (strain ATCC BAA-864 / DSM 15991 / KCTC 12146 / HTCC2501) TaxID=313596 RepID=A4CPH7_ROBBH|nr:rRNA methylase [Robiginitalea biformata HTCC2501]